MTRSQSLKARLAVDLAVQPLVADRIYPVTAIPPAGQTILTYKFDTHFDYDLSGVLAATVIELHAWSTDYDAAHALADAVYHCLQGFTGLLGGVGGINVIQCLIDHEQDIYTALTPDQGVFDVYSSYKMIYQMP